MIDNGYKELMKKKLYGLLREREKNGEWEKFLDTVLVELMGYPEDKRTTNYYFLYYKLNTCKYLSFKYYRKTIFECMNLFDGIDENGLF
jgi:hypothetical protein